MYRKQVLLEKLKEAAASVLPISLIVLTICFVLVPVDTGLMLSFVLATAMLILGICESCLKTRSIRKQKIIVGNISWVTGRTVTSRLADSI